MTNDYSRQAGRTGPGAVFGSKKLKAIAVRGTRPVEAADSGALREASLDLYRRAQGAATEKYRTLGTPANVLVLDRLAALPTRNFQQSTFEGAERISGEWFYQKHVAKVIACAGCPIGCDHLYRVSGGPPHRYPGRHGLRVALRAGPTVRGGRRRCILKATELCDQYGVDTMSTGVSIAWAMESYERGLISREEAGGLDLSFGNAEAMVAMVERIGLREGLGRLLGEGVKRASAQARRGLGPLGDARQGVGVPGLRAEEPQDAGSGAGRGHPGRLPQPVRRL